MVVLRTLIYTLATLSIVFPSAVFAADAKLFFSPITGTYTVGEIAKIRILVTSGGESVNALEGRITYDPVDVSVVEINSLSSAVTSWTSRPVVNDEIGEITFGGLLATSTVLEKAEIATLSVVPRRSGEVRLRFETGALMAADGTGGNILTSFGSGVYIGAPKDLTPEGNSSSMGEVLGVSADAEPLVIHSTTHPDQGAWYNKSDAELSWDISSSTLRVRLGLDENEDGRPTIPYAPPLDAKHITDLTDGEWYFHVGREEPAGWTPIATYRLGVDRTPPEPFTLLEVERADQTDPRVSFNIVATDTLSGVEHFEYAVNRGESEIWKDNGGHVLTYRAREPGVHELAVTAVDYAGNRTTASAQFEVTYLPTPSVQLAKGIPKEGDPLTLLLEATKSAKLNILLSYNGGEQKVLEARVGEDGTAHFRGDAKLLPGVYQIAAVALADNGAQSGESEPLTIDVPASFFGLLGRHPMIPVAAIALLVLFLFARNMFIKKYHAGETDEYEDAETDEMESVPVEPEKEMFAQVVISPAKKKTVSDVAPTRLPNMRA